MNRSLLHGLRLAMPALLILGALAPAASAQQPARPLNIVFCFADDMGRNASAYAKADGPGTVNDAIQTPNIDRLVAEGVLFRNAHVTAPSCTPCRSSLLSGQYFYRTGRGAILRGAVWDSSIPTFPLLLSDAGFHIGKSYKVWSPGTPVDAPFGGQQYAYQRSGGRINQFSQNVTRMVAEGKDLAAAKQEIYEEVRGNFASFLADRQPSQPFCFWFGPTNVHRKWIRGSGKALWGLDPDALEGKMPAFLPDVHEVREDLIDYFGEIMAFDAAVGVIVEELEKAGELDNTLLVVSGDHGAPGFPYGKCNLYDFGTGVPLVARGPGIQPGRVVDDFVNLMDLAPTFLEAGGVTPPPVMTGRSLMPVLLSDKEGRVDPARDFVITGRERHVEDANEGHLPYPQRAIRTKDYLYIINFQPDRWPMGNPYGIDEHNAPSEEDLTENTRVTFKDMDSGPTKAWLVAQRNNPMWIRHYELAFGKRPREELYIHADDPHQINNVAADPKYAAVRQELNRRLMEELQRSGDPRVTGDGDYFEKPPLAGPLPDEPAPPAKKKKKGKAKAS
jgi:N-sulfoglucosamine sulfohydrolase